MEYLEGIDLKTFINQYKERNEFIEEKIIYDIVLDICQGIKEIHTNNLIHRDLKPKNIFINADNKIKIGGFGITKQLDINDKYGNTSIETRYYIAPEIIKDEKYNNKVDIWAFGCIIYELLTLKIFFEDKKIHEFINKNLTKQTRKIDINKYNSKWKDLVDLLLKKDFKERPDIDKVYNYLNHELKDELEKKNSIIINMIKFSSEEVKKCKRNEIKNIKSKNIYVNFLILNSFNARN